MTIYYKKGYKYQLHQVCRLDLLGALPAYEKAIHVDYIALMPVTGHQFVGGNFSRLIIDKGYAWDGPSGLTIDTPNFMQGSLIHDALYQLMRLGFLDPKIWRQPADALLRRICLEDDMSEFRAWYTYHSVRGFGNPSTLEKNKKKVLSAP